MFLPPYLLFLQRTGKAPELVKFNHLANVETYLESCRGTPAIVYHTETGSQRHYDEEGTVVMEVSP